MVAFNHDVKEPVNPKNYNMNDTIIKISGNHKSRYDIKCQKCESKFVGSTCTMKYCSTKCEQYVNNRKKDYKKICTTCTSYRRVNKSGECSPCRNKKIYGRTRPTGKCSSCNRDGLVLTATKCESCFKKRTKFLGKSKGLSHGEAALRISIARIYPGSSIKHNFRPHWLMGTKGHPLEIDVAIPDLKIGFEYDGPAHFDKNHPWYKSTSIRDKVKNDMLALNGWTLVRVRKAFTPINLLEQLQKLERDLDIGEYSGGIEHKYITVSVINGHIIDADDFRTGGRRCIYRKAS